MQGGIEMTANVGSTDKKIRIIAGTILLIAGIFAPVGTGLRIGAFVIAGIAFATAFFSF